MVVKSILYSKEYGFKILINSNSREEELELEKFELQTLVESMNRKTDTENDLVTNGENKEMCDVATHSTNPNWGQIPISITIHSRDTLRKDD